MMRKSMFAALLVLIMLLGGCSDVSTAPTRNDESELVTETEAAAEAESTKGIYSSESNESKAPETSAALETAAEVTECKPVQSETVKQTEPVKRSEAEAPATKPTTENNNPPTVETPTQAASENAKTAYDFEFDMEAIKADCISIGQSMGLRLDTSLTPSNASWWNPVTASRSNQGEALKAISSFIPLKISAHTELMKSQILISAVKQKEMTNIWFTSFLHKRQQGLSLCFKNRGIFYTQNQERTV